MMKPFFCRIGSKTSIKDKILKLIPPHKTYVEAFVGGGAIYFAKEPSRFEVINDLDNNLIDGYRLLKKVNNDNILKALEIAERVNEIKNKKNRLEVLNEIVNMKYRDDGLKLYQILITMCNTFSSIGKGKIFKPHSQINKLNEIIEHKERLKNTKIFLTDYKNIINKFDAPDTFFFLDPPYEKSIGLYKNEMIDYEEMNNILSNIKGKFLLTINASPEIRRIFNNFNIKKIKVKGQASSRKNVDIGYDRYEFIITNY